MATTGATYGLNVVDMLHTVGSLSAESETTMTAQPTNNVYILKYEDTVIGCFSSQLRASVVGRQYIKWLLDNNKVEMIDQPSGLLRAAYERHLEARLSTTAIPVDEVYPHVLMGLRLFRVTLCYPELQCTGVEDVTFSYDVRCDAQPGQPYVQYVDREANRILVYLWARDIGSAADLARSYCSKMFSRIAAVWYGEDAADIESRKTMYATAQAVKIAEAVRNGKL